MGDWWSNYLGVFRDCSDWVAIDIEPLEFSESFGCRFIIFESALGWKPCFEEDAKALVDVSL